MKGIKLTNKDIDDKIIDKSIYRITDYECRNIKLNFGCKKCGTTWYVSVINIMQGSGCPKCAIKEKMVSDEEIDNKIKDKDLIRLENSKGMLIPIKFKCLKDGYIWNCRPSDIINRGSNCPRCVKRERKTNEDIDFILKDKKIIRTSEYKNYNTPIEFECLIDGIRWKTSLCRLLEGFGCPICNNLPINLTNEIVDKRIEHKSFIRITDKLPNGKFKFKCLIDEYEWEAKPYRKQGCPKCANILPLTNDIVDERLLGRKITRIGEFKRVMDKIQFKCDVDGYIWEATTDNILQGYGCPYCKKKNENRIYEYLITLYGKENVIREFKIYPFEDKQHFRLDFKVYDTLIEYNGMQHYKSLDFMGGDKAFERQQIRDKIIELYCKQNEIELIIIPYNLPEKKQYELISNLKEN